MQQLMQIAISYIAITICSIGAVYANTIVPMQLMEKNNTAVDIGSITAQDSQYGLLIIPNLSHLPPGSHGFHLHTNPACDQQGKAAGNHFDPRNTGKHAGPYSNIGHLGDLPPLFVDNSGNAKTIVLAPRLKEADLKNHSFILHRGGDNFSDTPKKLGGGGARLACGVIRAE